MKKMTDVELQILELIYTTKRRIAMCLSISTGALLFGMNMMQVPFASENITETEPQSISEENTDVIDNQKLLEIDQDQLDTGVVYVTTKDTYFYFPDGCSDDANLLGWAVKWMHETAYFPV